MGLCYLYKLAGGFYNTEILTVLKHAVVCSDHSTKHNGTQLHQISHTWPIASKNTLFPLMNPDRREEKNQSTIYCLEVAVDKTFYLNILGHLMRIQYQMDWKRNRNDRKIVKIFWERLEK